MGWLGSGCLFVHVALTMLVLAAFTAWRRSRVPL
jgi:hypothetical protein